MIRPALLFGALLVASGMAGPARAQSTTAAPPVAGTQCPDDFAAFKDETDPLSCTCPAEATQRGAIYGTDVYTADSSICRAALHAARVQRSGGPVTVVPEPGRRAYPGTTRNGITSTNYGPYTASFSFAGDPLPPPGATSAASSPAAPAAVTAAAPSQCPDDFQAFKDETDPLTCICPAEATQRGSVWGTDIYTADSSVCRAALHAARVQRSGGPVIVVPEPGRRAYPGTTRNGITSTNYGPYAASFRFAGDPIPPPAPAQAVTAATTPQPPPQAARPAAAPTQCPDDFTAFKDDTEPLTCICPGEATQRGAVWGTDIYTADSSVCRAALHAARITRAGGNVTVAQEPGRRTYPGTTRNGVTSINYGAYDASFRFAGDPPAPPATPGTPTPAPVATGPTQCPDDFMAFRGDPTPLVCTCPADATQRGAVWGTDIYTDDSSVCRAALHDGRITRAGGSVTVVSEPGRSAYPGTTRNGFASSNYGSYPGSFRFEGERIVRAALPSVAGPTQCPDNAIAFKEETAPVSCICPAETIGNGSVWGTDVYTADSALCRAAVHAGMITRLGGAVTFVMEPGRSAYAGTTRVGISSANYGPYEASFRFTGMPARASSQPVQAAIGDSLRTTGRVNLYIQFRTNSADIDIGSAAVMNELLAVLRADPALRLKLVGHTDSQGTRAINGPLSARRAASVRAWLISQGIAPDRLTADGRGPDEPIAPNTTEEGRALNRRVQATLAN